MKKNDKNNNRIYRKIMYFIDLWLSKGTASTIILLFAITSIIVFVIGILAMAFGGQGDSLGKTLWDTMNHTFDPGVLSGDSGGKFYLFMMLLATLLGVFFLAILIGLVNDGIQSRVQELSKGIEPVVENNHVVILGFNESAMICIRELIEAYKNQVNKRNVVVVMDQIPKQEMEDHLHKEIRNTGNLKVVFRSGSISNRTDLNRCAIATSKSIIISAYDDFDTIKSILACTGILNEAESEGTYITSVIYGSENEYAARIAGHDSSDRDNIFAVKNDRLELLMMENTISKIITHTCRQQGLSNVFIELFNFAGDEFYIARIADNKELYQKMAGRSIRQINRCLPNSTAVGVIRENGEVLIGDPNTVELAPGCQLIVIQADDDPVIAHKERKVRYTPSNAVYKPEPISILIIGCNEKLPYILAEMCEYLTPGTVVYLASPPAELDQWLTDDIIEEMVSKNIDSAIRIQKKDIVDENATKLSRRNTKINHYYDVFELLDECAPQHVLYLASDNLEDEEADESALKLLLYCRNYKELHPDAKFGITCEMRNVENQQLAQETLTSDFVISRNIASLMMSQIAENRELREIFEILLSSEGFEIYLKPAKYYLSLDPQKLVDLYSVQDAVAAKQEIFIGYQKNTPEGSAIYVNPSKLKNSKRAGIILTEEDNLIVLSENMSIPV